MKSNNRIRLLTVFIIVIFSNLFLLFPQKFSLLKLTGSNLENFFLAYAVDTIPIQIESDQSRLLEIANLTNFIFTEDNILKIERVNNGLLLTGLQPGTAPLYVWQDNVMTAYIITTVRGTTSTPFRFYRTNESLMNHQVIIVFKILVLLFLKIIF